MEPIINLLEGFNKSIKSIDATLKRFDKMFKSIDYLLNKPINAITYEQATIKQEQSKQDYVISPSYPGQTKESYCLECLIRHNLKALGLLEEAERFSINKGVITPEARKRVEQALKEIVTSEEDLSIDTEDRELAKMLNEIKAKQREFRKWVWTERLLTTQEDIGKLREAISRMNEIVELTRKAAEYHDQKYSCRSCEVESLKLDLDKKG